MNEKQNWLDEVNFSSDMMFQTVMRDESICKEVLELILGFPIRKIEIPKTEWELKNGIALGSVRFDVYVEDAEGRIFDVEMQNCFDGNVRKRARYYQGMIDTAMAREGLRHYDELADTYIIFFCNFNPFGGHRRIYRCQDECADERLGKSDGATKIYLCTTGEEADTPVAILEFLSYLKDGIPTNGLTQKIENQVVFWKRNEEWRDKMWENHAHEMDLRRAGFREGVAQGKAEGISQGKAEGISQAYDSFFRLAEALEKDGKPGLISEAAKDRALFEKLCQEYEIS